MHPPEQVPGIPGATMRRVERLPDNLLDGLAAGQFSHATPGQLLSVVPGVGSFLARDGSIIEFSHADDADPGVIALILNGTARGALIHQRGELPLHAATLVPPGGQAAFAICGPSGAGKSTLGAELSRRGWLLVADDTTRVTWDGAGGVAWPSRDSIKLWRDACDAVGINVGTAERVTRDLDKYYVRVAACDGPTRLGSIVELSPAGGNMSLTAGEKMALVTRNTYRPSQIVPLGVQKEHVQLVMRLANACSIFQLPGARTATVAALADMIEDLI